MVSRDNYHHNVALGPFLNLPDAVSSWSGLLNLASLEYDDSELVCPTLALHSFADVDNSKVIAKLPSVDPWPDPNNTAATKHSFARGDLVFVSVGAGIDQSIYQGTLKVVEVTSDERTFVYEANGTATVPPVAPFQFREGSKALRPLATVQVALQQAPDKWRVTATVKALYNAPVDHGLEIGEVVRILDIGGPDSHSVILNGNFQLVEADRTAGTFKYDVTSASMPPSPGNWPGYYGRVWRCDWFLIEGDIFELVIRSPHPGGLLRPVPVYMYVGGSAPHYIVRQLVVRDTLVRSIDNRYDPNTVWPAEGIELQASDGVRGVENALFQRNVIRLAVTDMPGAGSIGYLGSGVKTFDNNSPEGNLLLARNTIDPTLTAPELVTAIRTTVDDTLLAAFLK